MKILTRIAVAAVLGMSLVSTAAMADPAKGQKYYTKKLKKACDFSGAKMAGMHTQDEWEEIFEEGKLVEEIQKQCPNMRGEIDEKWQKHLFDFFWKYGSDSGEVPAC